MRSQAQRAYLHIHHPTIAARFEAETPTGADLPEHVKKKRKMHAEMNATIRAAAGRRG